VEDLELSTGGVNVQALKLLKLFKLMRMLKLAKPRAFKLNLLETSDTYNETEAS